LATKASVPPPEDALNDTRRHRKVGRCGVAGRWRTR